MYLQMMSKTFQYKYIPIYEDPLKVLSIRRL